MDKGFNKLSIGRGEQKILQCHTFIRYWNHYKKHVNFIYLTDIPIKTITKAFKMHENVLDLGKTGTLVSLMGKEKEWEDGLNKGDPRDVMLEILSNWLKSSEDVTVCQLIKMVESVDIIPVKVALQNILDAANPEPCTETGKI